MLRRLTALSLLACTLCSTSAFSEDKFQQPGPVQLTKEGDRWAEKTLRRLTLEEKIGQMLMVRAIVEFRNVASPEFQQMTAQVRRFHLGGLLLTAPSDSGFVFRNQPYEAAMLVNALQRESDVPLIFAGDLERGPSMRFQGVTQFPSAMAFAAGSDPANVERFARIVATESRALGVQWNFFPVADVNSNPINPIINTRSFGEDPRQVGDLVTRYIRGSVAGGMLTTAKHFPGHGDTSTDSHLEFAIVTGDRARLNAVELVPFRAAIGAGVDAVMVAHVTVPALDPDPNRVASTSPVIISDLLKGQLGFQGLVVPDALDMAALTRLYPQSGRAAVEAVKAGNDMVLLPVDLEAAFNALVAAVRAGEISEAQIDASVRKILNAKAAVGLYRARLVDVAQLDRVLAQPENVQFGQEVAQAAITLVRDNGRLLPLKKVGTTASALPYGQVEAPPAPVLAVLLLEDLRSETGRVFEQQLKARVPGARVVWLDPRNTAAMAPQVVDLAQRADAVIVAAYVVASGGKFVIINGKAVNTVGLQEGPSNLVKAILQVAAAKTVLVSLGNPYLASGFPEVQNYVCTYSNVAVSEVAAVKALFGEAPMAGRLPVTIPGIAARGAGGGGAGRPNVVTVSRQGGTSNVHLRD
ncbi:MAG: glycoside hydrolase family 3 protein [Acidobacteriota bacterium]|nr:glycoside hydrolase family 3 protein [Acidobacteriota bacterium]